MQAQFFSWFSSMEFSEDSEVRAKRWNSLETIAKSPSGQTLEVLTRLAFRTKLQHLTAEAGLVRDQMARGAPPLADEELALMAASALALILDGMDATSARAAALVTGAACAGLRPLKQPMDLVGMATKVQTCLAETSRRRPSLEQQKLVNPQLDIQASLDGLQEGNVATVRVAIDALVAATSKTLTAMATRQRQFESAVQGYVRVQDEELDILWWLQGGHCPAFGLPFAGISPDYRPIIFAVELAALTKVLPGPTALPSLLTRAGVDNSVQLTIPGAIQGLPRDWLARLLPEDKAARVSAVTTPILEAIRRRQEVDGQDTWITVWSTVTGIDHTTALPALQLSETLYRELLQVALG